MVHLLHAPKFSTYLGKAVGAARASVRPNYDVTLSTFDADLFQDTKALAALVPELKRSQG
jgi:hypothetical protein